MGVRHPFSARAGYVSLSSMSSERSAAVKALVVLPA
jgi:hypothetical protein